MKKVSEHLP
jgi:hypothetical protein